MERSVSRPPAAKPDVSVVIPTCNRHEVLERCLTALTGQTHPNFEVVVVDDASIDDTPAFLEKFAADHPELNLRWLRNESHAGANPSRNRGIAEARGDLVAFEDSDCIADLQWLERLAAPFADPRVAAVTGLVVDPPPRNLFELAFKGTHRVVGSGPARRLIGGNMCVRRELLKTFLLDEDRASTARLSDGSPDLTVSGRGDEEGLFLMLRAAGYEVVTAPEAVVLHEHGYTARSFFKQAYRGGRSAARLVYKYHLPPRLDMLPFLLGYLSLPLVGVNMRLALIPAGFFLVALAAISYNDLVLKGKTAGETIRTFPLLLAYYHVRLVGYVLEAVALRLGRRNITRHRLRKKSAPGLEARPQN